MVLSTYLIEYSHDESPSRVRSVKVRDIAEDGAVEQIKNMVGHGAIIVSVAKIDTDTRRSTQQLEDLITLHLTMLREKRQAETALHDLWEMVETDYGMETAQSAIYGICITRGISVKQAMAAYDQEL